MENNTSTTHEPAEKIMAFNPLLSAALLRLTIKKKWFEMILSGEKKEEYRELKFYWADRLMGGFSSTYGYIDELNPNFKNFDAIEFRNGYAIKSPTIIVECKGIEIGVGKSEWGATDKKCFMLKFGNIVSKTNPTER